MSLASRGQLPTYFFCHSSGERRPAGVPGLNLFGWLGSPAHPWPNHCVLGIEYGEWPRWVPGSLTWTTLPCDWGKGKLCCYYQKGHLILDREDTQISLIASPFSASIFLICKMEMMRLPEALMGSAKFWHSVMTNVTVLTATLSNGSISILFPGDMRWLYMRATSCHYPSSSVVPRSLELVKPLGRSVT